MKSAYSPSLLTLYTGRFISLTGDNLYLVALTFLLAQRYSVSLTLLWVIRLIAPILVGLWAGSVVDHAGAKITAIFSDVTNFAATALMPYFLHSYILFLLVFIVAASSEFFRASQNPMITSLSDADSRHKVNSIIGTISYAATFIGPLLGGLLLLRGHSVPFFSQAATFVFSALMTTFLPISPLERTIGQKGIRNSLQNFFSDLKMAWQYTRNHETLRRIMWLTSLLNFGTGAISAYQALYMSKALHLGPDGYAIVVSVEGITFIAAGAVNTRFAKKWRPIRLIPVGVILLVLGFIPYSLAVNFAMVIASLLIIATGMVTLVTAMRTVRQNSIPVEVQGRIVSLQTLLPTASAAASVLIAGAFIPLFSIRAIMIGSTVVMLFCLPIAFTMLRRGEPTPPPMPPPRNVAGDFAD